ncbi:MAG TPA: hypothetical protein VN980_08330 [Alphaproteobacteria bacterium]|nr:hypothetical protein [Alphaproteobacteria bacterium]
MNIVGSRAKNIRSAIARLILGLAYAAVMLGVSMGPALAKDQKHDRGHRDDRGRYYDRNDRNWNGEGGYYYAPPPPVYAPPPVYEAPPEYYSSPGISIVLPLRFH